MINIAIIGAGLSGLTLAHRLRQHANITIFEKSRGVGGRMSTRYAKPFYFDHGAQFFNAKTESFQSFISNMIEDGIIELWNARFVEFEGEKIEKRRIWGQHHPHYVGVPRMNAIPKYLAQDLNIYLNTKINIIQYNKKWALIDEQDSNVGEFDWVISTAPAKQTAYLMPKSFKYHNNILSTKMVGCFSLMLGFNTPPKLDFDAALVRDADISWISVNSSKPGRKSAFCMLIHSTNKWAELHMDDDKAQVIDYLCNETSRVIGHNVSLADHKDLHRWRFANIEKQTNNQIFIDADKRLAACGDWCIQGRVEAAFTSALNLSDSVITTIE